MHGQPLFVSGMRVGCWREWRGVIAAEQLRIVWKYEGCSAGRRRAFQQAQSRSVELSSGIARGMPECNDD